MKYFRSYPWGLQLFLFMMMIVTMMGFGSIMLLTFLPKFTPYTLSQLGWVNEQSPAALVRTAIAVQGFSSVTLFLVPALLFSHLAHPKPKDYLGLRAPGKSIQLVLVVLLMLGAMPVLQMIENLISHINFGAKIKADQAKNESMIAVFLNMPSFSAFLRVFVVMAIVPAIGEELFFRGILLRFSKKRSRSMIFPVIFTAIVFSFTHANVYGFLSIFLAGVLLAVIYNLTGSLWCSIAAHLFFNGFQVVLSYLSNTNPGLKKFLDNDSVPFYLVIGGAILFGVSFYLLLKHKTPLPANWTDDFPPETPAAEEWDFIEKS